MTTPETPCPRHPDEKANRTCSRCGAPGCYLCARQVGDQTVCLTCRTSGAGEGSGSGLTVVLALVVVGVVGMIMWLARPNAPAGPGPVATDPAQTGPDPAAPTPSPADTAPAASPVVAPPAQAPSTEPRRMAYPTQGVAFTMPAGCTIMTRLEGPAFAAKVLKDGKELVEVCVITVYPWVRTGETLNANGPYTEGQRAILPGMREVPFGGERWSFRDSPPQLFLFDPERMVFVRTIGRQAPWEVGGPELALAASLEWLELPPLRERARVRHRLSEEKAAGPAEEALLTQNHDLAVKIRKLGSLPPSVFGAVQWAERDDLTQVEALMVRDFLAEVLVFVQQGVETHQR